MPEAVYIYIYTPKRKTKQSSSLDKAKARNVTYKAKARNVTYAGLLLKKQTSSQ